MMNQFEAEMQKLQEECYFGYKDGVYGVFGPHGFMPVDEHGNAVIKFASAGEFVTTFENKEYVIVFHDKD